MNQPRGITPFTFAEAKHSAFRQLVEHAHQECIGFCAASPVYWQRAGMPEHPNDLSGHNCLVYSQSPKPSSWAFVDNNGDNLAIKVKGNLRSDAGRVLLDAAVNGQGVLIGPTYMLADAMKAGQLEAALETFSRPATALYAVYPCSKLVSSKVRAFVDHLVEAWGVAALRGISPAARVRLVDHPES